MYEITIEGDVNDGDYIKEVSEITQNELNAIMPIIKVIKEKGGHNYEGDLIVEDASIDDIAFFNNLVPYGEYNDVHTITSITLIENPRKIVLL